MLRRGRHSLSTSPYAPKRSTTAASQPSSESPTNLSNYTDSWWPERRHGLTAASLFGWRSSAGQPASCAAASAARSGRSSRRHGGESTERRSTSAGRAGTLTTVSGEKVDWFIGAAFGLLFVLLNTGSLPGNLALALRTLASM